MKLQITAILFIACTVAGVSAADFTSVAEAIAEEQTGLWQLADRAFENPAIIAWKSNLSLTKAGADFNGTATDNAVDPRSGSGGREWGLFASTYTKYRSSTLTGRGEYSSGITRDVRWNETADPGLLYPYLLADSAGGDLRTENYRFSGGYADQRGRWVWGGRLGYRATLQHRAVDPRPRNVVGQLDISAAGGFNFVKDYYAVAGLSLMKYKQTNEVEFLSETGVDKIFHLTGLGNHYSRFDGVGLSTYYSGFSAGVDLNIYPASGQGFFASTQFKRFNFTNVLTDLNKLPLTGVNHRQFTAQTGWMFERGALNGGVAGDIDIYRRHGHENYFGDATSGIYPLSGSNEMYADNRVNAGLTARMGLKTAPLKRIFAQVDINWQHQSIVYLLPYSFMDLNSVEPSLKVAGVSNIGKSWIFNGTCSASFIIPYDCTAEFSNDADTELGGLLDAERGTFELNSRSGSKIRLEIGVARALGKYALRLSGEWQLTTVKGVSNRNDYAVSLALNF
ncbi:MAG: hypothetical protein K2M80_04075 [Muribaculaceae bacterium]|nr:hypothetical protein [Muribaculaceae bacterium]